SSSVVQACPVAGTHWRSSAQIAQTSGRSACSTAQVRQIQVVVTRPPCQDPPTPARRPPCPPCPPPYGGGRRRKRTAARGSPSPGGGPRRGRSLGWPDVARPARTHLARPGVVRGRRRLG